MHTSGSKFLDGGRHLTPADVGEQSSPTISPGARNERQGPIIQTNPAGPARPPAWLGVPIPAAAAGLHAVPPQVSSWSCGLNGAARGLAVMGRPVSSYASFVAGAPRLDVFGIAIGPPPAQLARYLESGGQVPRGADGAEAWSEAHADETTFTDSLRAGWAEGCPSLMLVRADAIRLHWVLALGEAADGAVCVLDSDGCIKAQAGGQAGLRQQCDLSASLGFQLGLLQGHGMARYNLLRFGRGGRPGDVSAAPSSRAPSEPRGEGLGLGLGPRPPHRAAGERAPR